MKTPEQQKLPLRHKRWRPTQAYVHELERQLLLARILIKTLENKAHNEATESIKIMARLLARVVA